MELEIQKLQQKKLSSIIVEELITMLASGKLQKGDKLPAERILAEQYGVSRSTLREALSALEVLGLIEMRTGGGSYITGLDIIPFIKMISRLFIHSETMLNELLELRMLLETEAIYLIVGHGLSSKAFKPLAAIVNDMKSCMLEGTGTKSAQLDIDFHKELFALSGNSVLQKCGEAIGIILEDSVRFNRGKILQQESSGETLFSQHKQICAALKCGNKEMAAKVLKTHLEYVKEIKA